ncbi:MAG: tetratricopeptide repeat protein [Deltaproteobacteria bacterium]
MKSATWLIVSCALICIAGAGSPLLAETDADRLSAEGDRLLKARKFQEAWTAYQQALDKNWEHCGAMYGKGRVLFSTAKYAKARKTLEELVAFCPGEWRGRLLLGYAELASGVPREARKTFLNLSEMNPGNVSALVGLGYAEYYCGNPLAGEQYLKKALTLQPKNKVLQRLVQRMEQDNREYLRAQEAQERQRLVNEFNLAVSRAGREWSRQAAEQRAENLALDEEDISPWIYETEPYWWEPYGRRRRGWWSPYGGVWAGPVWGGTIVGDQRFRHPRWRKYEHFRSRGQGFKRSIKRRRPAAVRPYSRGTTPRR